MNPMRWWAGLSTDDRAWINAQIKTLKNVGVTALAFLVASAGSNGVSDDKSFESWAASHWIWYTLAFFVGAGNALNSRKNDPVPPSPPPAPPSVKESP